MNQKTYSSSSVENYLSDYNKFLQQLQLNSDLKKAQDFVLAQLNELDNAIKKSPVIIDIFKKQFTGTRYSPWTHDVKPLEGLNMDAARINNSITKNLP